MKHAKPAAVDRPPQCPSPAAARRRVSERRPRGDVASPSGATSSPIGVWKTFDDKTGNARAVVRIYDDHGRLFGRIESTFTPGGEHRVCAPCTDERKDQPIIGLVIIRNMRKDGPDYDGGDILDPESGWIYRCKMHVAADGTRLVLRGYLAVPWMGRTQTWERQG